MNLYSKRIFDYLVDKISSGEFPGGKKIPTEKELAGRFDTTRMNAHYAVKHLEARGIVIRRKRLGTLVRKDLSAEGLSNALTHSLRRAVIYTGNKNPESYIQWNDETINQLEDCLQENKISVIVRPFPSTRKDIQRYIEKPEPNVTESVVFFPDAENHKLLKDNLDLLTARRAEIFILNRGGTQPDELPFHTLSLDPFTEGVIAAEYITNRKSGKVYVLSTSTSLNSLWGISRIRGLKVVMENSAGPEIIDGGAELPFRRALDIISGSNEKPFFICLIDCAAAELTDYLGTRKLRPPADFNLLSFNNDPRYRTYNLTTVAPPVERIASSLSQMIVDREKNSGVINIIKAQSRLIKRMTA